MTRLPRPVLVLAAVLFAGVPAQAASAPTTSYPSISKLSQLKLGVGDTLTVKGKAFRSGTGRNTVVFKRDGGRAVFVKAGKSSRTQLTVTIPAKLLGALTQKAGKPVETRFRVRVLASRFGRRYTPAQASPLIGPNALASKVNSDDCDGDLIPNATDPDDDNDLLSDAFEATLKTDPCNSDSDGDGMSDGWDTSPHSTTTAGPSLRRSSAPAPTPSTARTGRSTPTATASRTSSSTRRGRPSVRTSFR